MADGQCNIIWIGVFILNGGWLYSGTRFSYLSVYFLAVVGGIANGIAHPLLSLNEGGYFPGLITSPFVLVIGVLLLTKLRKIQ